MNRLANLTVCAIVTTGLCGIGLIRLLHNGYRALHMLGPEGSE